MNDEKKQTVSPTWGVPSEAWAGGQREELESIGKAKKKTKK